MHRGSPRLVMRAKPDGVLKLQINNIATLIQISGLNNDCNQHRKPLGSQQAKAGHCVMYLAWLRTLQTFSFSLNIWAFDLLICALPPVIPAVKSLPVCLCVTSGKPWKTVLLITFGLITFILALNLLGAYEAQVRHIPSIASTCLLPFSKQARLGVQLNSQEAQRAVSGNFSMPHHRRLPSEVDINKSVNWINSPGVWVWYISLIIAGWLLTSALLNDPGLAWTYVHLIHGVITYYVLHWTKGSMSPGDPTEQGMYDRLTVWEQMDGQIYGTSNRKFFTVVPIILFVLATHGADFRKQPLGLNFVVVLVLLIAKMPHLHKVRIFGINQY